MAFKAELLRKKLKEEGRTRKFLAETTRKTERTVSRWLSGENPPKGKDLDLIANALRCRPQDFDPAYVDEGSGVAMYARVSVASHNAYEIMRMRYGVTHKSIIELAPVLFSIVASYALKVPDDDLAFYNEGIRRGLDSPLPGGNDYRRYNGFVIDQRASKSFACFGLPASDEMEEEPRNLFFEAISRLSLGTGDQVSTEFFHTPEPGEAPSAAGFIPDLKLLTALTGGDESLMNSLINGRIRLSKCWEDYQKSGSSNFEDFSGILRRELASEDDQHHTKLAKKREESAAKLKSWRAYYEERHPDLAQEYDQLVETYCHEDGWIPAHCPEEVKEIYWSEPYKEHRFIDVDRLPDVPKTFGASITARFTSQIAQRFDQLEAHRSRLKVEFEELGK